MINVDRLRRPVTGGAAFSVFCPNRSKRSPAFFNACAFFMSLIHIGMLPACPEPAPSVLRAGFACVPSLSGSCAGQAARRAVFQRRAAPCLSPAACSPCFRQPGCRSVSFSLGCGFLPGRDDKGGSARRKHVRQHVSCTIRIAICKSLFVTDESPGNPVKWAMQRAANER